MASLKCFEIRSVDNSRLVSHIPFLANGIEKMPKEPSRRQILIIKSGAADMQDRSIGTPIRFHLASGVFLPFAPWMCRVKVGEVDATAPSVYIQN